MPQLKSRDIKNTDTKIHKAVASDLRAELRRNETSRVKALIENKDSAELEQYIQDIESDILLNQKPMLELFIKLEMLKFKRRELVLAITYLATSTRNDLNYITVGEITLNKKVEQIRVAEIKNKLSFLIIFKDESYIVLNMIHEDLKEIRYATPRYQRIIHLEQMEQEEIRQQTREDNRAKRG